MESGSHGRVKLYREGEVVFAQGEPGDSMYQILQGSVTISRQYESGTRELASLGPGEFMGEMGLLQGHLRTASAIAALDSEVLCINRDELHLRIRQDTQFTADLLLTLCARLEHTNKFLDEVLQLEEGAWQEVEQLINQIHRVIASGKPSV